MKGLSGKHKSPYKQIDFKNYNKNTNTNEMVIEELPDSVEVTPRVEYHNQPAYT